MKDYLIKPMPCYGTYNKDKVYCALCERLQHISHGTNSAWDDTFDHCKKLVELEDKLDIDRLLKV